MVDSRTYTPTPAAHQFSSELGYGNPGAEDFSVRSCLLEAHLWICLSSVSESAKSVVLKTFGRTYLGHFGSRQSLVNDNFQKC